jgi:DNA-binding response OmpR family regulator
MPDTVLPDRLLIAEDDPQPLPLLKATFRTGGLRVLTAGTGTQALDVARAERPDRLLLDEAGADAYLTKPFSPTRLVDSVQSMPGTERAT